MTPVNPIPKRKFRSRNNAGSVAFELSAGALVTMAIVAFSLNVCFAMIAYGLNDHACRDAARAAAQGQTQSEAQSLASAIIKSYNSGSSSMTPITVVNVSYQDFGGNPAPQDVPMVSVSTKASINLPAPIAIFGRDVFGRVLPVQKQYTFPIVRLKTNI